MSSQDHNLNEWCKDDIHAMFGLTYASYLTVPRSLLQSMPAAWQHSFKTLMDELLDSYGGYDLTYTVHARDERGHFRLDPLQNYQRGRRYVAPYSFSDALTEQGGDA